MHEPEALWHLKSAKNNYFIILDNLITPMEMLTYGEAGLEVAFKTFFSVFSGSSYLGPDIATVPLYDFPQVRNGISGSSIGSDLGRSQ